MDAHTSPRNRLKSSTIPFNFSGLGWVILYFRVESGRAAIVRNQVLYHQLLTSFQGRPEHLK